MRVQGGGSRCHGASAIGFRKSCAIACVLVCRQMCLPMRYCGVVNYAE